ADHPRILQVDVKISRCRLDHTRPGLSAFAAIAWQMGAEIEGVDRSIKFPLYRLVYRMHIRLGVNSPCDPRLVCHDDDEKAGVPQHPHRIAREWKHAQVLDTREVVD